MTAWAEDFEERNARHKAEIGALNEEIDRLLAALKQEREKAEEAAQLREQVKRLTLALDEALAMVRARRDIERQEQEAGL